MKAVAQGTLWGSQYLPSIAGAGKSGTRFPNMAAFPRCSRMASLPHRCLTASSSSCPDWRASAAPSLSTSVTATFWDYFFACAIFYAFSNNANKSNKFEYVILVVVVDIFVYDICRCTSHPLLILCAYSSKTITVGVSMTVRNCRIQDTCKMSNLKFFS